MTCSGDMLNILYPKEEPPQIASKMRLLRALNMGGHRGNNHLRLELRRIEAWLETWMLRRLLVQVKMGPSQRISIRPKESRKEEGRETRDTALLGIPPNLLEALLFFADVSLVCLQKDVLTAYEAMAGEHDDQVSMGNVVVRYGKTIEVDSPYYLHSSDHLGLVFLTHPLTENGENYFTWRRNMTTALESKNKVGFVDNFVTKLDVNSQDFQPRMKCNVIVLSWLTNSLVKEIQSSAAHTETTSELWQISMSDSFKELHQEYMN
ncbi:hypothetical protein RJ640_010827 [Escallonia rubra]|uniref:Retrotransposon Copia-like N-terminal domain-containing protein n=1 Tax=Escallonia rubra TaxID=112253 RepID=A0AA88QUI9_9ASTE|nr:hypothetical protein RJ640_010827 [Escallonia rubra]